MEFSVKGREALKEQRERAQAPDDPGKEWGFNRADRAAVDAYKGIIAVVDEAESRLDATNLKVGEYSQRIRTIESEAENRASGHNKQKSREEV